MTAINAIEGISTVMNVAGVYENKISRYELQAKRPRRVESVSAANASKRYLQSSVDGNGTHFEAYA